MNPPTLRDAMAAVDARKQAAGVGEGVNRLDDHRGFLAGTDLEPVDINAATYRVAGSVVPVLLALDTAEELGEGIRGLWLDGVVHGLELARQRAELENLARQERDVRVAKRLAAVRDVLGGIRAPLERAEDLARLRGIMAELSDNIDELGGLR